MWEARPGLQVVQHVETDWDLTVNEIVAGVKAPQYLQILTIRTVMAFVDGIGLAFEEIRNPELIYISGVHEAAFSSLCFRPVKKTDISSLTAILAPGPKVLEPA